MLEYDENSDLITISKDFEKKYIENKYIKNKKFHELNIDEQKNIEYIWKNDENRLKDLINIIIDRCNDDDISIYIKPYINILLSDRYIILIKYILNNISNLSEYIAIKKINNYAQNIWYQYAYELKKSENIQLLKIKDICKYILKDEKNISNYIYNNIYKYDTEFFSYIKYAINFEEKNIEKLNFDPYINPSNWLCILTIIDNGIKKCISKYIWNDIVNLTYIITTPQENIKIEFMKNLISMQPRYKWVIYKSLLRNIIYYFENNEHKNIKLYNSCKVVLKNYDDFLPDDIIDESLSDFDRDVIEKEEHLYTFLRLNYTKKK
eukprot:GHVL01016586.1.p1 GENE.GHVL01016586.1~~GHVL01016586.1.p1  ORF type:complete len:374 (-),score=172.36 GHVL01016586.1:58-1023(-)